MSIEVTEQFFYFYTRYRIVLIRKYLLISFDRHARRKLEYESDNTVTDRKTEVVSDLASNRTVSMTGEVDYRKNALSQNHNIENSSMIHEKSSLSPRNRKKEIKKSGWFHR